METPQFKKGNLIFLKQVAVDLIYVVKEQVDQVVVARRLDATEDQFENLSVEKVVKLADEQEMLLPTDVMGAIEKQREFILTPPKKKGEKKKGFEGLPKASLEEILGILAGVGIAVGDEEEKGEEEPNGEDSD